MLRMGFVSLPLIASDAAVTTRYMPYLRQPQDYENAADIEAGNRPRRPLMRTRKKIKCLRHRRAFMNNV